MSKAADGNDDARSCYSKRHYPNEDAARRTIKRVYDERGVRLRAYHCYLCGGWHLTKQLAVPT